jgi:hypothetical protein
MQAHDQLPKAFEKVVPGERQVVSLMTAHDTLNGEQVY